MESWKRITLVVLVLIGGTTLFAYWSINQFDGVFDDFDSAFNNLSASYSVNTRPVRQSLSASPEILELASPSLEISVTPVTSIGPEPAPVSPSFTFPKKDTQVYIGCMYPVAWQSSATIRSLDAVLVDAGSREVVGPEKSGLAKENTIEKESQNLNWKVGVVLPGAYYIKVSKINGVEAVFRSGVFKINTMPKGIDEKEKINTCRESAVLT